MALFDLGVPQVREELFALGLEPSIMASDGARAELTQALESLGAWQGLIHLQEIWAQKGFKVLQSGYREIRASGPLSGTGILFSGEFRDTQDQRVFSEKRAVHLAGRAGALSRRGFGEWRLQGFGKVQGRSYLVIERTKQPSAPGKEDLSLPDQLVFFSDKPLVLDPQASRISFRLGQDSLEMGAPVYLVEVAGG